MENGSNLSPVEETILKRVLSNSTVEGVIVTNEEGQLQYTSLDNNVTFFISSKLLSFADIVRSTIRDIDPADNLLTLRLRTQHKEMMVVTPNDGMQVIAIQKMNLSSSSSLSTSAKQQNDNENNDNFS
ncbi:unnamed protein product [Rotaria sp. Silwood2]|nr:unnamed protein product [Rotaria sp. Silwood2]CAF2855021.1 unnamed protein product [Rotaria sp. Silwood2]CAF3012795.1 unnamed protein product [Rotaria sp. Silwood2]CAF3947036.1 unnamed protein product [Rotaria sp. Silwood2]CAF4029458.1 unnamed protein product [Rotaria sp. Silwood2]